MNMSQENSNWLSITIAVSLYDGNLNSSFWIKFICLCNSFTFYGSTLFWGCLKSVSLTIKRRFDYKVNFKIHQTNKKTCSKSIQITPQLCDEAFGPSKCSLLKTVTHISWIFTGTFTYKIALCMLIKKHKKMPWLKRNKLVCNLRL